MSFMRFEEDEEQEYAQTLDTVAQYCRLRGRNDYAVRLEELRDLFR
tara:strand:+ start:2089 stop:2226 length:138 start_codon:yes stop_codon:yes gene_type:complete